MKFRDAYERIEHKGVKFERPTMTQQHFKDECDVNNIIKRYMQTGVIPDYLVNASEGVYGDFADVGDYTDMQNTLVRAKESFASLPAEIRRRFNEDPAQLIDFVRNDANYDEAVKLGLVTKKIAPAPDQKDAE